jgi:hypothetical protein
MKSDRPWTLNRHIPRCPCPKQAHVLIFSASLVYRFSCPIPIILGWQVIERVSSQWMGDIELCITSNSTFIVYLTPDGAKLSDVAVTDFDWLEEYLEVPPSDGDLEKYGPWYDKAQDNEAFLFHESCWSALVKHFANGEVDLNRLFEV